ncbi:DUF1700 domain-containing protein [Phenylobacterium sp. SCN 70-31]|uniref:DUF1700 domain-containing protein n=1 Tax=Phenylobacterium sp. SCN 70-31 TaxID=1660129 RepID=UPI00086CBD87|nr:DUF1700 domain-containing protein [Phenylobacterium sp. SCN 70-31]ODT87126.1 MAG: hypothetical protein ABS78_12930 [Phenylobacterium sp. SCN 70-31]
MTRQAFIARLREGLRGLPPQAVADIVADYEAHFTDGEAAGRTEAEVAAALGDPDRLAREIRAESSLNRWREERTASSAAAAVFAVIGLGAIDILVLLPILMGVASAMIAVAVAAIVAFFAGAVVFAAGPFLAPPGGPVAAVLAGIGIMAGSASAGAVLTILSIGLINALVWYGRLHYRLLKPALEPQNAASQG